jgi:hypothetical protein
LKSPRQFVRRRARIPLTLPIRVICRESFEYEWTEQTRLVDVTHFGAGFTLTRPVDVGRLIHLSMPLPQQLRCFDHHQPMYQVWGLVRHIFAIPDTGPEQPVLFRIGVAFVGKDAPQSYEEDPTIRYDPVEITVGQKTRWKLGKRPSPNQRRETRLVIPLEVLVETLDENGNPRSREYTVTETISSLGTCVPTSLDVNVGQVLRISSARDQVSTFAAIRSRKVAPDGVTRLGLEFIGDPWPLDRE